MIKLRERAETLGVVLFFKDTKTSNLKDYYRQCRQTGALDTGVHFFVSPEGTVETDRAIDSIAGWNLPDNEVSIYVLIQTSTGKPSDSQSFVLARLLADLQKRYKDIKTIERTE